VSRDTFTLWNKQYNGITGIYYLTSYMLRFSNTKNPSLSPFIDKGKKQEARKELINRSFIFYNGRRRISRRPSEPLQS
jgi:hypothetical protein